MTNSEALVIVPTYNERATIEEVLSRLIGAGEGGVEVLVVDDASEDGTGDAVERLASSNAGVHLIRREAKLGLGTAYVTGFRWALERAYWAVVEMDGDLSHDPACVPLLLGALAGADVAIGSRYVSGGSVPHWGALRRGLSRAGNLYAKAALGLGIEDSTSGFRAYRASFLAAAELGTLTSEGYAFQIELTRRARRTGARVVEVPITFAERAAGTSKLSRAVVAEAIVSVTWWALGDRLWARSKR